jgi:hypothetical protein
MCWGKKLRSDYIEKFNILPAILKEEDISEFVHFTCAIYFKRKLYFPGNIRVVDFDIASLFYGLVSAREGVGLQAFLMH